ncbi:MAG: molecular chaperone HtpG [Geminicoccaceae bacterium]|nr:molecular chaperone HtpG [Geminicoccaceae bacterium]MDW8371377.1 molecular chaperone HtpG [Geminicoccaceae bacterium]
MDEVVQPFEAEVGRVLEIVVNSLYKDRAVFLRELISNASDACDKLRYESLSKPELLGTDPKLEIRILADPGANLLTVVDNGIGMDKDELAANLGTIARSGTARFLEQLTGDRASDVKLIGQFGVGFYSVFMVADRVVVRSTRAGQEKGWIWASDGKTGFTIREDEEPLPRGTAVTLHLKDDAKEFLDEAKIRTIVRTYSDHVGFPIVLEAKPKPGDTRTKAHEPTQINTGSALWARPRSEITEEQYREFYHHVAHRFDEPFARVHFTAEGTLSYTALLFVPSHRPFDLYDIKHRHGVRLYVRRVFITDQLEELLPRYLRFVAGVVDSEDLQLNVSRETLQHGTVVQKMRRQLTKRILDELARKAAEAGAAEAGGAAPAGADEGAARPNGEATTEAGAKGPSYLDWWAELGAVLKEGLYEDPENREKLLELARFRSTRGPGWVSLADYVARMRPGQDSIFYVTGENAEALRTSPQLEAALAKGCEVLLLDDAVDEFWLGEVKEYQGKKFVSLTKGEVDLSRIAEEGRIETPDELWDEDFKRLLAKLEALLAGEVKAVRASERLRESAVCLVADAQGLDFRLERILRQHQQIERLSKPILEVNGRHELVRKMAAMAKDPAREQDLAELARLLLDQARIVQGEPIPDPGAFSRRMSAFLAKGLPAAA